MINLQRIDQKQTQILRQAVDSGQLAHSYLFVANDPTIARNTAYWLPCYYNCQGTDKPDGKCQNCQQILSGNHPDLLAVALEDRQSISIDQIRPLKEELAKSPVESTIRFFIIEQAQTLTLSAANALLNLLEEPVAPAEDVKEEPVILQDEEPLTEEEPKKKKPEEMIEEFPDDIFTGNVEEVELDDEEESSR